MSDNKVPEKTEGEVLNSAVISSVEASNNRAEGSSDEENAEGLDPANTLGITKLTE